MNTTVIVPTYEEALNIGPFTAALRAALPLARVLVVDDNSPDGTGAIVAALAAEDSKVQLLSRAQKEGLGRAYVAAFSTALQDGWTEVVVMMDADFSHDHAHLESLLARLEVQTWSSARAT